MQEGGILIVYTLINLLSQGNNYYSSVNVRLNPINGNWHHATFITICNSLGLVVSPMGTALDTYLELTLKDFHTS